jgi:hypothetical protein
MPLVKVCDMHDLTEWWVEVEATRAFGLDGETYELDLCGEHDAELSAAFQPYVGAARKVARAHLLQGAAQRKRMSSPATNTS